MYSLEHLQSMFADPGRGAPMARALRHMVSADDVVLEVGAGAGHFAVIAAQSGADHVYAIEPSPLLAIGPELAARHGVGDRITWITETVEAVTLPRKATVLVGDLRGAHTLVGTAIASMNDARRRLCVDGVRELFVRDVLYAAPVDCGGTRVSDASTPIFGLDCAPVLRRTTVQPRGALKLRPENLLAAETAWWTLEHQRETPTDAHADLQFAVERDGVLDGIVVWFDALLANGEWISNSPRVPVRPWGRQLLPLRTPIDVRTGDDVSASLRFRALDDQYVVRWSVDVTPPAGSGRIGTRVTHSTLEQLTTFPQEMLRRDTAHLPVITRDAALFARLASLATGEHTVARIIDTIYAEMPDLFADRRSAMRRIAAYLELADVSPRVGPGSSVT